MHNLTVLFVLTIIDLRIVKKAVTVFIRMYLLLQQKDLLRESFIYLIIIWFSLNISSQ